METNVVAGQDSAAVPLIGAILLATDMVTERDMRALLPPSALTCTTRIPFENPTTPDNLRKTLPHLGTAASLLVPGGDLSAIYFSCTSATITLGESVVHDAIHAQRPGIEIVTPLAAAKRAFAALAAKRVSVFTPYVAQTAKVVVDHLSDSGFEIASTLGLDMEDDRDMAVLPAQTIIDYAVSATAPDAEALFISCTALPAATLVAQIEAAIGRPVVTSNLAGLWQASRIAGIFKPDAAHGRLMGLHDFGEGA